MQSVRLRAVEYIPSYELERREQEELRRKAEESPHPGN